MCHAPCAPCVQVSSDADSYTYTYSDTCLWFSLQYYTYSCLRWLCAGPVTSALTGWYGTRVVGLCGAAIYALGIALAAFRPHIAYSYATLGVIAGASQWLLVHSRWCNSSSRVLVNAGSFFQRQIRLIQM